MMERLQCAGLRSKIMTASAAAALFRDGMTVGMSGFTRAGDCKALPAALAERARREPLRLNLITGASLGNDSDGVMAEAGLLARRLPFQADARLRREINEGRVMFIDQHLSETVEQLRVGHLPRIDIAVVEAVAILPDGSIVPSMSVGNSASFAAQAEQVIVELNTSVPMSLMGLHDIYLPEDRPGRKPIPLTEPDQRIGTPAIPVDPARIAAIVVSGPIADMIGRRAQLFVSAILIAAFSFLAPWLIGSGNGGQDAFVIMGFGVLGLSFGQAAGSVSSRFSLGYRYSGAALTSDLSWLIGAGFAPLVALTLSSKFGLPFVGYYLLSGAICTILALFVSERLPVRRKDN